MNGSVRGNRRLVRTLLVIGFALAVMARIGFGAMFLDNLTMWIEP